jgi:hypothetical protein
MKLSVCTQNKAYGIRKFNLSRNQKEYLIHGRQELDLIIIIPNVQVNFDWPDIVLRMDAGSLSAWV